MVLITSHSSSSGHIAPVIEWTVSNATILGIAGSTDFKSSSKCWGSLWRNMCLGAPQLRIPCIIEAWFPESENICTPNKFNRTIIQLIAWNLNK